MGDLATEVDDRGDRVRFVIATADPVRGRLPRAHGLTDRTALIRAALRGA